LKEGSITTVARTVAEARDREFNEQVDEGGNAACIALVCATAASLPSVSFGLRGVSSELRDELFVDLWDQRGRTMKVRCPGRRFC
jgi:hypothetical protein